MDRRRLGMACRHGSRDRGALRGASAEVRPRKTPQLARPPPALDQARTRRPLPWARGDGSRIWIQPPWRRSGSGWRRTSSSRSRSTTRVVRDLLVALFAEGHVLIEDYPGVGKTALARALARSIDAEYARVQCTADLLPADIVGTNVFNQRESALRVPPRARCSPTSSSSTRSTAARRRPSPGCSSACRSATSPSTATSTSSRGRSSSSRPRTRPSTRAPIRCPRRSSTGSWSASRSAIRAPVEEAEMLEEHAAHDRVHDLGPVTDVGTVRAAQAGGRGGPRQRGAAPLRRRARRGDPQRHPGRARRQPARGADAVPGRRRRSRRSTGATTCFPTTSRRWRRPCSPTGCCSRPRRRQGDAAAVIADALERVPAL